MNMNILVLDIEATSLSEKKGKIVEIGAVDLNLENGEITKVFDSLLLEDGFDSKHWEYVTAKERDGNEPPPYFKGWIFGNSNLTPKMVMDAPPAKEVLLKFQEVVNKYKESGVTAYNFGYDSKFLIDRGIEFGKVLPDPMKVATPVCKLPGRYGYKWPKVQEAFDIFFPNTGYNESHRGADDAKHEAMIVYHLYKLGEFKV